MDRVWSFRALANTIVDMLRSMRWYFIKRQEMKRLRRVLKEMKDMSQSIYQPNMEDNDDHHLHPRMIQYNHHNHVPTYDHHRLA